MIVASSCAAAGDTGTPALTLEEFESLLDELVVKLEDAAVPGVGIDLDLAVRQALG